MFIRYTLIFYSATWLMWFYMDVKITYFQWLILPRKIFHHSFECFLFVGVDHADDLFYIFKTPLNSDIEPGSPEDKSIRRFCKLWTNFAKYGNPNSPTRDPLLSIVWKAFNNESKNYLEINQELMARMKPLEERMGFWENLYIHRYETNAKLWEQYLIQ